MTTRDYRLTILWTAAVLLAACSGSDADDEATAAPAPADSDMVLFGTDLGGTLTRTSTIDNMWTDGVEVAVGDCSSGVVHTYTVSGGSASSGGTATLVTAAAAGSRSLDNTFYWGAVSEERTFHAWYPYSATQPTSASVAANQSSLTAAAYQQQDVVYAPPVATPYKTEALLTFYHQLCRVMVTVNSSATDNAKAVTSVSVGSGNLALSGSVNMGYTGSGGGGTAASWSLGSAGSTVTMRQTEADAENAIYTFECLLPPQRGGSETTTLFSITTNQTSQYKDSYDFQAGCQYHYVLTLSASGVLNISTLEVADWATEMFTDFTVTVPIGY